MSTAGASYTQGFPEYPADSLSWNTPPCCCAVISVQECSWCRSPVPQGGAAHPSLNSVGNTPLPLQSIVAPKSELRRTAAAACPRPLLLLLLLVAQPRRPRPNACSRWRPRHHLLLLLCCWVCSQGWQRLHGNRPAGTCMLLVVVVLLLPHACCGCNCRPEGVAAATARPAAEDASGASTTL